jgi:hypothetical protein
MSETNNDDIGNTVAHIFREVLTRSEELQGPRGEVMDAILDSKFLRAIVLGTREIIMKDDLPEGCNTIAGVIALAFIAGIGYATLVKHEEECPALHPLTDKVQ